jgi:hypothetical protein
VHLEPGATFVGGGLWHPDGGALHRLRASIDERPGRWRRVLNERGFRERFLGLGDASSKSSANKKKGKGRKKSSGDGDGEGGDGGDGVGGEEQALKAFAEKNKEGALKTRPKGFNPEHRDMQLLKLKNFTIGTKVDEGLFTKAGAQEQIGQIVGDMVGFVSLPCFLRSMTDEWWLLAGLDYADLTRSRTLIGLSCRTRGTTMTRTRPRRMSDEEQW